MCKKLVFFLFLIILSIQSFSQEVEKQKLMYLYSKLAQVKYADLLLSKTSVDYIVSRGTKEAQDLVVLSNFLREDIGLRELIITEDQRKTDYLNCESVCDVVFVSWNIGNFQSDLVAIGRYPVNMKFSFCDGIDIDFSFDINVNGYTYNLGNAFKRALIKNIGRPDQLMPSEAFGLKKNDIVIDQNGLEEYFKSQKIKNKIEGIYKLYSGTSINSIDKVAIIEKDNKLLIVNLENTFFNKDWEYGEIRGEIQKTASERFYFGKLSNLMKSYLDISISNSNDGLLEIEFVKTKEKFILIKLQ